MLLNVTENIHYYIMVNKEKIKKLICNSRRGINWFECAPSWYEKVDLKQF